MSHQNRAKKLISQGTIEIEINSKEDKIIPTTLLLKVKLTSEEEWDITKAHICIHCNM